MSDIRDIILKFLIENRGYAISILPHTRKDFFSNRHDRNIVKYVSGFFAKYNDLPTYEILKLYTNREKTFNDADRDEAFQRFDELQAYSVGDINVEWLIEETEKHFQEMALMNALNESIYLFNEHKPVSGITAKIEDALAFSFDNSIGHDYFADVDEQYAYYMSDVAKYPTHLSDMNASTAGGFARKTLNVFLGQPGSGKTQMLIDLAGHYCSSGLNVLFITLELDTKKLRQRCDANFLNFKVNDLLKVDKEKYYTKFEELKKKTHGNFIIKDFPMASVSVLNFKALVNDIYQKQKWKPDVIMVDYIGVVLPLRAVQNNMYLAGKYVAEELRGLASECNAICFSPAQVNRDAYDKLEGGLANVAESAGIAHVADYMAIIATNDDLKVSGLAYIHTIKNRLNALEDHQSYNLGYDSHHMRFYDKTDDVPSPAPEYVEKLKELTNKKDKTMDHTEIDMNHIDNLEADLLGD